jgi:adenosylmethionine-8-amino-7-oxononanoate aminotransferase
LVERSQALGETMLASLAGLAAHPHVGDVRGRGLLAGVELVADKASRRPFPRSERRAEGVAARCFEAGLVTYPSGGAATGRDGDVLILAPPFVVTAPQIAEMVGILDSVLGALEL